MVSLAAIKPCNSTGVSTITSTHSSDCTICKCRTCILQIQNNLRLFSFAVNRCPRKTPGPSHVASLKAQSLRWKALLLFSEQLPAQAQLAAGNSYLLVGQNHHRQGGVVLDQLMKQLFCHRQSGMIGRVHDIDQQQHFGQVHLPVWTQRFTAPDWKRRQQHRIHQVIQPALLPEVQTAGPGLKTQGIWVNKTQKYLSYCIWDQK